MFPAECYRGYTNKNPPLKDVKIKPRFSNSQNILEKIKTRKKFRFEDFEKNKSPPQAKKIEEK